MAGLLEVRVRRGAVSRPRPNPGRIRRRPGPVTSRRSGGSRRARPLAPTEWDDRWTSATGWRSASRSTGPHLRAVAYRMLGSLSEADDAVQEAWLRLSRADAERVENLGGWLTTVVARVCLNMLRSRKTRREEPLGAHLPDPIVTGDARPTRRRGAAGRLGRPGAARGARDADPGRAAGVRAARHLRPALRRDRADRRAHARRRASAGQPGPPPRAGRHRCPTPTSPGSERSSTPSSPRPADGDFDALVAVLDPDVVVRADGGDLPGASVVVHGAPTWRRPP